MRKEQKKGSLERTRPQFPEENAKSAQNEELRGRNSKTIRYNTLYQKRVRRDDSSHSNKLLRERYKEKNSMVNVKNKLVHKTDYQSKFIQEINQ